MKISRREFYKAPDQLFIQAAMFTRNGLNSSKHDYIFFDKHKSP